MVEMTVWRLGVDQQNQVLVILSDPSDERLLPIVIGPCEANAIAMELRGEGFERPLTHDLFINLLETLGRRLTKIEICRLEDSVFYAYLFISNGEHVSQVDSRPSDAIALALRANAKIYVADEVLEQAQVLRSDIEATEEMQRAKFQDIMTKVDISAEDEDALGESEGTEGREDDEREMEDTQ